MGNWNLLTLRYEAMEAGCGEAGKRRGYSEERSDEGTSCHRWTPVLTRSISRSVLISNKLTENP